MKNALATALLIPVAITKIVLVLLGLVVVPIALATRHLTLGKSDLDHWPDMFWLWGNDEEGCPEWWLVRAKQDWWTRYWPEFWWYAVRNPCNNWRFLFEDVSLAECHVKSNWDVLLPMEAEPMRQAGMQKAHLFIRHGWKCGYRRVWLNEGGRYSEFWLGWKLASGVPGLGFAMQLRLKRPIGR